MMKIVSVAPGDLTLPRGTPIRVKKIAKYLSDNTDIEYRLFSSKEINLSNATQVVSTDNFWKNIIKLLQLRYSGKVDIYILHTLTTLKYLLLLKVFTRAKIVLEVHGFIAEEAYLKGSISKFRYKLNRNIHNLVFNLCDLVTVSGLESKKNIQKYNSNCQVLFDAADTALFTPDTKPAYSFGNNESIVIGYAGNSSSYQGLDFLKKVFKKLREDNQNIHLALLLSDSNKSQNSSDGIITIARSPQDKVPGFLASCDILVVPRPDNIVTRVSFASKILDYMAMGKPVIVSDVGGSSTVITDGVDGYLYLPDNQDEFIDRFNKLRDSTKREQIGSAARSLIVKKYSTDVLQDEIYRLIKEISK